MAIRRHLLILIILFACCIGQVKAQLLAVKTDLVLDCALTPNLNIELVTGSKTSLNATVFGNYHPWGTDIKMIGVMPEFRYWFSGRPLTREFVGIALVGTAYDMTFGKKNFHGDAYGGGFTFGYAFVLSTHWNIEAYGSIGAVYYHHKRYYTTDFAIEDRRNDYGCAIIPFKLGVSIAYIIK